MILFWTLTLLSVCGVVVFATLVSLFLYHCPKLTPADRPPANAPLISIIVPARNEAGSIERCVASLLSQNYAHIEVIAVDDDSSDSTPAILARLAAQDSRLKVVKSGPLSTGWTGKNNAVAHGVAAASGTWLLFVDADVYLHPGALSAAYQTAQQHGVALLSLWARQELETFWERAVQPVIIGVNLVTDPLLRGNDLRHPHIALGNGQFMLAERKAYEHVGGHAAVRDEVVEDQMLSRRFKQAGYALLMMDGSRVLSTRMYASLAGIWEGWSKNNFLTLNRNFALMIGSVVGVYFVAVSPFVLTLWGLIAFKFSHYFLDPLVINLLVVTALLWTRWRTRSFFPMPLHEYLSHGLGGIVFIGIFLNSAYQHTFGRGVTWKGRRYSDADPVADA